MEETLRRASRRRRFLLVLGMIVVLTIAALPVLHCLFRIRATTAIEDGDLRTIRVLMTLDPYLLNAHEPADSPFWNGPIWPDRLVALATMVHQKPIVLYMVERGADLSPAEWCLQHSPLNAAAEWGDTDVVKAMLRAGADPNAPDACGLSPVHHAVLSGNKKAWLLLKAYGGKDTSLIHQFAAFGELDELRSLIKRSPGDVKAELRGLTPLDYAAANDHADAVAFLLAHGGKVTKSSLALAVESGNLETAKLLLTHGAEVTQYDLGTAEDDGNIEMRRLLREHIDREATPE